MKKIIFIIILAIIAIAFPRQRVQDAAATPNVNFKRIGKASWYSRRSPGTNSKTANNEHFDDSDLTCAIWGVAFNRKIKVTNLENGKSVVVRVNDRGPSEKYVRKGRVIDLTKKAFRQLGTTKKGIIDVELEFL